MEPNIKYKLNDSRLVAALECLGIDNKKLNKLIDDAGSVWGCSMQGAKVSIDVNTQSNRIAPGSSQKIRITFPFLLLDAIAECEEGHWYEYPKYKPNCSNRYMITNCYGNVAIDFYAEGEGWLTSKDDEVKAFRLLPPAFRTPKNETQPLK